MTGFCAHGVRLDHECTACITTPGGVTVTNPIPQDMSSQGVPNPYASGDLGEAAALRAEEARPGDHDGPLPHIAPPYCGMCSPFGGSDPEHTGVSDVQAEAVEGLRQELSSVRGVNEALAGTCGKLARAADLVLEEVDAIRQEYVLGKAMAARLDRIEELLRGEKR